MWSHVLLRLLEQMHFVATPGPFDPANPMFRKYYASVKKRGPFHPHKADGTTQAYNLYLKSFTKPPSPNVWTTDLLHGVDKLYVELVSPVMEDLGRDDRPSWSNAMDKYFEALQQLCQETWALKASTSSDPKEVELHTNATPKLEWVIKLAAVGEGYYLPLPTKTFMKTFLSKLNNASTAIQWVSVHRPTSVRLYGWLHARAVVRVATRPRGCTSGYTPAHMSR